MIVDCEDAMKEVRLLNAYVARAGANHERAIEAIAYAAEEIGCVNATAAQKNLLRQLAAQLVGFRLARLNGDGNGEREFHKLYLKIRKKLEERGFAEEFLREFSFEITKRLTA